MLAACTDREKFVASLLMAVEHSDWKLLVAVRINKRRDAEFVASCS
jgi:hypothetical protein